MTIVDVPKKLLHFLQTRDSFFIIPHKEPDGDCIGSALALASYLRRIGKTCLLHNMGPFVKRDIKMWEHHFSGRISQELKAQHPHAGVIVLDCSTLDRIGELALDVQDMPMAVIDHHSAGLPFGDVQFINPTSPATSILIQQIIEAQGEQLTKEEGALIFHAFSTDTGFFRHLDQNSGPVFSFVQRMVEAGNSPKDMYFMLNSGASLIGRRHLGKILERTESHGKGQVVVTWEYLEETQAIGKENRESDLVYQMLTGIEGVEVVITLREERKDFITGGLRSRTRVDVGAIALSLGGGGHARASGFAMEGDLESVKRRVLEKVIDSL